MSWSPESDATLAPWVGGSMEGNADLWALATSPPCTHSPVLAPLGWRRGERKCTQFLLSGAHVLKREK